MNDVHVSKDNISEFYKNCDEALEICQSNGISDLIIGGDLWQSRSSQTLSTLLAVRDFLMKADQMGIVVTLAEGNHCKVDQESIYGYSHVYSQYPNVDVIDNWVRYDYGKLQLYIMSYFPENGSFIDKIDEIIKELDSSKTNVLYIHQGINGALAVPSDKELPTKIFKPFDKVLVGHYHDRCAIPRTSIEYIGSSRQHNFGEDEEKGYTILYQDGSTEFIKNAVNIRYVTIEAVFSEISDNLIAKIKQIKQNPLYRIKLKISCKEKDIQKIDKAKLFECGVSKIDIQAEDIVAEVGKSTGLDTKFDKTGIKKEYSSFCEQKDVTDVELGLKYLEKIN